MTRTCSDPNHLQKSVYLPMPDMFFTKHGGESPQSRTPRHLLVRDRVCRIAAMSRHRSQSAMGMAKYINMIRAAQGPTM